MPDLILDACVVTNLCRGSLPEINTILIARSNAGFRNWISIRQQAEILESVIKFATERGDQDPSRSARESLERVLEYCMWLSALSIEGDNLRDRDPTAYSLSYAASRIGKETCVLTTDCKRLNRGNPFIDVATVQKLDIQQSVEFIDLETQQDQIRPQLEHNLHKILHHSQYVMGPEVFQLEEELAKYIGVEHCVCVSSGTDALLIAMMALDLKPGDEVITTPFTFFATAETIILLGAKPVYVDIDKRTYTLDPSLVEAAINERTKAILPVSMFGQCADMDRINEIADSYQIPVIEDAAQSFGATYKGRHSCNLGQIGCTSFFPAKPLGAYGDAGACFTQDSQLAERIREIRDHGQSGRYDHVSIGINGRMDTLQAAVLLAKLDIFEEELNSRAQVAENYSELLKPAENSGCLTLPGLEPHNISSWAQYTVEVNQRSYIQNMLSEKGIPTAVHYPQPMYKQPATVESITHCPVTDRAVGRVLSLPMHPYLTIQTQERVVDSLNQALNF